MEKQGKRRQLLFSLENPVLQELRTRYNHDTVELIRALETVRAILWSF